MNIDETVFLAKQRKTLWDALVEEIKNFSFKSEQSKYAIRVAIVVTVSVYISWLIQLSSASSVAMSAFIVSQDTVGATLNKAFMRIFATVIGGILAFWCFVLFSESVVLFLISGSVLCFIPLYFKEVDKQYTYTWILFGFTVILVLFSSVSSGSPDPNTAFQVTYYRILEVSIGVIIGAVGSNFIFPKLSASIARKELIAIFGSWNQLIKLLFQKYNGVNQSDDFEALYIAQAKRITKLTGLIQSVEYERKYWSVKLPYDQLITISRQLNELIYHCYYHLDGQNEPYDFDKLEDTLNQTFGYITEQFERLTYNFMLPNLDATKKMLSSVVDKFNTKSTKDNMIIVEFSSFINDFFSRYQVLKIKTKMKKLHIFRHYKRIIFYDGITNINMSYVKRAFTVTILVFLMPLFWAEVGFLEYMQVAVTIYFCLMLERRSSQYKTISRITGCMVGAMYALLVLGLNIQDGLYMLVVILIGFYIFQYIFAGSSKVTYFGFQACIVIALGLLGGMSPPDSIMPILNRMLGIFVGILTINFFEAVANHQTPLNEIRNNIKHFRKSLLRVLPLLESHSSLHENANNDLNTLYKNMVYLRHFSSGDITIDKLAQDLSESFRVTYHAIYHLRLNPIQLEQSIERYLKDFIIRLKAVLASKENSFAQLLRNKRHLERIKRDINRIGSENMRSYHIETLSHYLQTLIDYYCVWYQLESDNLRIKYASKKDW